MEKFLLASYSDPVYSLLTGGAARKTLGLKTRRLVFIAHNLRSPNLSPFTRTLCTSFYTLTQKTYVLNNELDLTVHMKHKTVHLLFVNHKHYMNKKRTYTLLFKNRKFFLYKKNIKSFG